MAFSPWFSWANRPRIWMINWDPLLWKIPSMGPNPMFADSCWLLATLKISPTFSWLSNAPLVAIWCFSPPQKNKKTSSVGIVIPTRIGKIEQIILYPVFFVQSFGAFQSHGGTPHISYPLFPCIFHEIIQKGPHDMVYGDESAIKIPGWVNTHQCQIWRT